MPYKVIIIPYDESKEIFLDEDFNNFCLNKKIKLLKAEFFKNNEKPYWSVFIEYQSILEETEKVKDLSEAESLLLQRLKEWRREKAEKLGFPVYIICNNSQLISIVKKVPKTLESLRQIKCFGRKKIENYGKEILDIIKNFYEVNK